MHDVRAFTSGPGPVAVESHVGPGQAGLTLRNTSAGAAFAACTAAERDLQRFQDFHKSQVKVNARILLSTRQTFRNDTASVGLAAAAYALGGRRAELAVSIDRGVLVAGHTWGAEGAAVHNNDTTMSNLKNEERHKQGFQDTQMQWRIPKKSNWCSLQNE